VIQVEKLYPDEWKMLAESAHVSVFDEVRSPDLDRISYALIAKSGSDLVGYLTARETDAETVYWQFGGMFRDFRGTTKTMQTYVAFINWTKNKYKRITTFVENVNIPYLRLAMSCGFLITGIKNFKNTILVELTLEFEGEI
jgi:RimJ/RimL family protein N-acetyltransferase